MAEPVIRINQSTKPIRITGVQGSVRIGTPGSTGEANLGANVGGEVEVFKDKVGATLNFRTFKGIGGIGVALNGDVIEIDGSGMTSTGTPTFLAFFDAAGDLADSVLFVDNAATPTTVTIPLTIKGPASDFILHSDEADSGSAVGFSLKTLNLDKDTFTPGALHTEWIDAGDDELMSLTPEGVLSVGGALIDATSVAFNTSFTAAPNTNFEILSNGATRQLLLRGGVAFAHGGVRVQDNSTAITWCAFGNAGVHHTLGVRENTTTIDDTDSPYVISVSEADAHVLFVDTTGGTVAITLPNPATGGAPFGNGRKFIIKDIAIAGTNNITVTSAVGNVDGGASVVINTDKGYREFMSDGTDYWVIASN